MNWFNNLFKKKDKKEKTGKVIGSYKIVLENKGFYDIKVGDQFEGCACGNFFSNQVCTHIDGDFVYGTTTLAVFRKEYIRPVQNNNPPPVLESYGSLKEHHDSIKESLKL